LLNLVEMSLTWYFL
jgi:hypothetical protein